MTTFIIIGIIALLLLFGVAIYNRLVRLRALVKEAFSGITVQLRRRADLIPNLVETVKGYAAQESKVLTDVVEARAKATQVTLPPDVLTNPEAFQKFQEAQSQLSGALARLLAVVENYPDLKSNQNFLALQSQLEGTENRIAIARRDYITSVKDGAFYGWPFSYYGQHVDVRVSPQNPELVAKAIAPDYAVGPHTASLGLTFAEGSKLPAQFSNGAFIGQHGSWNRKPHSGYKVIFVPFEGGKPKGQPVDVLTGFLNSDEKAMGRPVGVVIDQQGDLLVADDVGNKVWRVSAVK